MSEVHIYHNPSCSKSRETLALLQEQGVELKVTEYLKDAPGVEEITSILSKLDVGARTLMRKGEEIYKELNLDNPELSEEQLIQAMADHPRLMERPVVVVGNEARIGRPPHTVLEIVK